MNILYLATRSPWPPTDGGRVLMASTIDGLLARGHHVTVVAPGAGEAPDGVPAGVRLHLLPVPGRSLLSSTALAVVRGCPASVARHEQPHVRAAVARLLGEERFDIVHVEQAQAVSQAAPAFERAVPVVLRAQNVESHLWHGLARHGRGWLRLASIEAARLARWESRVVGLAAATVALTPRDADELRALGPRGAIVEVVRAPMAPRLPGSGPALRGHPAVVVFGSSWLPNVDGAHWFIREIWPAVAHALPDAHLHVFRFKGPATAPRVHYHPAPKDSHAAFPAGGVLAVPLRIGSGIRMRILEAWARGVPVVATSVAAAGLERSDPPAVCQADTAIEFIGAFRELAASPARAAALADAGRATLTRWHAPDDLAAALEDVYRAARAAGAARSSTTRSS